MGKMAKYLWKTKKFKEKILEVENGNRRDKSVILHKEYECILEKHENQLKNFKKSLREFSWMGEEIISMQKWMSFVYLTKSFRRYNGRNQPIIIAAGKMKYLWINLIINMHKLYIEYFKMLLKSTKYNPIKKM